MNNERCLIIDNQTHELRFRDEANDTSKICNYHIFAFG